MRDPYQVLGVGKGASAADIKSAYRQLAKKFHPDSNPGDDKAAARFSEVSSAYELLGDKDKRAQFDRGEIDAEGKPVFQGFNPFAGGAGGTASAGGFDGAQGINPEDIFSEIFGAFGERGRTRTRTRQPARGSDLRYTLKVDFTEAANGATRRVTLGGAKTLDVTIPKGVTDGQQIRLRGQGEQPPGASPGDAIVTVQVQPHPIFTRDGNDIRVDLPVTLYEAVLGDTVRVPTLDGSVELKIPPGTSSGRVLRLKGKGLQPKGSSTAGDLLVTVRIVLPKAVDGELEAAARRLRDDAPYDVRGAQFGNKP